MATLSQLSRWHCIIIWQFGARLEIQAHFSLPANLQGVTQSYRENPHRLTYAELNVFNIPFKLWCNQNDQIYFSALQYNEKKIITKHLLKSCHISIKLT